MTVFRIEEIPGPNGGLDGREVNIVLEFERDAVKRNATVSYIAMNMVREWEDEILRLGFDQSFVEEVRREIGKKPR